MQAVRTGTVVDRLNVRSYGTEGWKALDFGGHIEVILETPQDCDEVIKAAAAAKSEMLGEACGAVAPHSGAVCALPSGHPFRHESGHTPAIVWDDPSIASDEAAAVLAAPIASGQPVTVTDDEPQYCEAPDPDGRWHCALPLGHDGHHYSPREMAEVPAWWPGDAVPEVCGLPVLGSDVPCHLFASHAPLPGCPGAGERASLRIAKGASS